MNDTTKTQEQIKSEILHELKDLAGSNAENDLQEFTFSALALDGMMETTEPDQIVTIKRLINLLKLAVSLKE